MLPVDNQFDMLQMMVNNADVVIENQLQQQQIQPLLQQEEGLRRVVSADNLRIGRQQQKQQEESYRRRKSETDVEPLQKKRRKLQHRVRIQVEPRLVVEPLPLALEEYNETCWYSKEDLQTARRSARRLSRLLHNSGSDAVLMDTFGEAMCGLTHSKENLAESPNPAMDTTKQDHQDQHNKAKVVNKLKRCSAFWKQRGLERLGQQHSISRSMQVCYVKSSVLLEQTSQYLNGKQDPERLAQVSRETSGPSQQFAQMLAMADAAMAQRIQAETTITAATTNSNGSSTATHSTYTKTAATA